MIVGGGGVSVGLSAGQRGWKLPRLWRPEFQFWSTTFHLLATTSSF